MLKVQLHYNNHLIAGAIEILQVQQHFKHFHNPLSCNA